MLIVWRIVARFTTRKIIKFLYFQQWLPNNKSAILIDDFKSPKELAEFLLNLNENDYEYNTYLRHKSFDKIPVTNQVLLDHLSTRPYRTKSIIPDFECFVCSNSFPTKITKGYECGDELAFPQTEEKRVTELDWQSYVKQGKCEAETFEYFMRKNVPFSEKDFTNELSGRYDNGRCEMWRQKKIHRKI